MYEKLHLFFKLLLEKNVSTNEISARRQFDHLFKNIDLKNKKVLDVGGGIGIYSFYASIMGARQVVCLEPELEGGKNTMNQKFLELRDALKIQNVELVKETIQNYQSDQKFDIILSMASINHLNENACINLLKDEQSYKIYYELFNKFFNLLNENGVMIIMDVGQKNFWSDLGLKNPFVPAVEWHKHQSPQKWAEIGLKAGFKKKNIKWVSLNRINNFPQFINKPLAYFFASHFHLYLYK